MLNEGLDNLTANISHFIHFIIQKDLNLGRKLIWKISIISIIAMHFLKWYLMSVTIEETLAPISLQFHAVLTQLLL